MGGPLPPDSGRHTARDEHTVDAASAKKIALCVFGLLVVAVGWLYMLDIRSGNLDSTLVKRATVLADISFATKACLNRKQKVNTKMRSQKDEIKRYRRKKNSDALEFKKKERGCEQQLEEIRDHRKKKLDFEIASLKAKLGDDGALSMKYYMVESLAKVQDAEPRVVWTQNLSTGDLRNTLVVELAQILGTPVESIQAITDVELVQQVDGL